MKTAVFYDLENIGLASRKGEFESQLPSLIKKIEASPLTGKIILQKAYISKSHTALPKIEPALKKLKVDLVLVEPINPLAASARSKKRNLVDFKMSVDVVATVSRKRSATTVAIASGDQDFGFLCQQIKEMGRKLLIISRFSNIGETMLKLCDDWVDINGAGLSPKDMRKLVETRIQTIDHKEDFLKGLVALLHAMEDDLLVRRYMTSPGMPLDMFHFIVQQKMSEFPKFDKLGFGKLSDFLETLLGCTNFEYKNNTVRFNGNKQQLPAKALFEAIMLPPPGYTKEELFRYYDILAGIENIDEMVLYVAFMKRSGILQNGVLCDKDDILATIRERIEDFVENSEIILDTDSLTEIDNEL